VHDQLETRLRQSRLRAIYDNASGALSAFCHTVQDRTDSLTAVLLLDNSELFESFLDKLQTEPESSIQRLDQIIGSADPNTYRLLAQWLLQQEVPKELVALTSSKELEELEPGRLSFERVIVWGGHYSTPKREKIRAALPGAAVEFFGDFERGSEAALLGPSDLVVWIVPFSNHPDYYGVKRECTQRGSSFYHFNHAGYLPLIDELKKLDRNGRSSL